MKILVRSGTNTKNTPSDSKDAFLLAINTNYVDGIEVNLNLTKDGNIIVYNDNCFMGHPKHKISDLTLADISKYNLGTKVKKHNVITLEGLLELFKTTTKLLVLNLENHGENNNIFIDKIVQIINNYPNDNIYVKSPCKEIVLNIKDRIDKAHTGAVIRNGEGYFWGLDLDFYSISVQDVSLLECCNNINNQVNQNHLIMLGDITNSNEYKEIKNYLGDNIMDNSYIITSNVVNLAEDII